MVQYALHHEVAGLDYEVRTTPKLMVVILATKELTVVSVHRIGEVYHLTVRGHWPLAWLSCFSSSTSVTQETTHV